jgi:hypothetical protein
MLFFDSLARIFAVTRRFANASTDARVAAALARSHRAEERRYRRMLWLTDGLLGRLEVRNLRGGRMNEGMRRDIGRTLDQLTPAARARFAGCDTVQQALDGVFDVQDELLRVRQRLLRFNLNWEEGASPDGLVRQTA